MANVVRAISADTRVGRLLFSVELSNTVIVRKRAESTALFAALLFAARRRARGAGQRPRQGRIAFRGRRRRPDDQCVAVRRSQTSTTTNWSNLLAALIDQLAAMPPRP